MAFAGIKQGYGRHIWIFGIEDARKKARTWIRNLYIFEPLYHTSTSLAKLSMSVLEDLTPR